MLVLLKPLSTLAAPELPGADRIFGALCWGLRAVCGEATLGEWLTACGNGEPPALLSAGMPWVRLGPRRVELLPRPLVPGSPRNVRWVSRELWEALVRPVGSVPPAILELGPVAVLEPQALDGFRPLRSIPVPRTVAVRRRALFGDEPGLHERSELAFPFGTGWAFLVTVRDPAWTDRIQAAIRWVSDTGWGAERSTGKGVAGVSFEPNPLPAEAPTSEGSVTESSDTGLFISLSAWHPKPEERSALSSRLSTTGADYALTLRDGMAHPGRPLLMIRDASALPWPTGLNASRTIGSCPEVGDGPFRSRRWGFAYPIGVRRPAAVATVSGSLVSSSPESSSGSPGTSA